MANKWITFFSQTGAEIADLSESIGRWPDLIITNKRPENLRTIDPRIVEYGYTEIPNKPTTSDLDAVLQDNAIITLHGWLRIMPEVICNKYLIYNGHPGLITKYPELKGKDPQQRFFDEKYKYNYYGSVVHKVVPEVDSGEIVSECKRFNTITSLDQAFNNLRSTSLTAWIDFLQTDSIITV